MNKKSGFPKDFDLLIHCYDHSQNYVVRVYVQSMQDLNDVIDRYCHRSDIEYVEVLV